MLEIKRSRIDRNNWYDYYLKDENNQLNIIFMGNGDLYFTPNILRKNCKSEFLITKENMIIYNLFTQLFEDFDKCEIFNVEEYELEYMDSYEKEERFQRNKNWNKELKESTIYKKVFNNDTITWISDDSISFDYETADSLQIIKKNNCFKLKFTFYEDEFPHSRSIRIRNSGSRYNPFNMIMMNFFIKLQDYNPEYHQIDIEEYMYKKLIKK